MYLDHKEGKKILFEVGDVLHSCSVDFFLMQGTALGAYRDKGFTDTEKDIDLGVLYEDIFSNFESLLLQFISLGYDVEAFVAPFDKPRTMVLWKDNVHVDIVSWFKWKNKRVNSAPRRSWIKPPYCIVHEDKIIEDQGSVQLFGRTFALPYNIESYLELEYGRDWRIPREDNVSRTRIYDYLETEGVPYDYLRTISKS